jgi:hypothetical protein
MFPHRQKSRRFKSDGPFSIYSSVMIGIVEEIPHNTAEMCWNTIMLNPHAFCDCQWHIFQ